MKYTKPYSELEKFAVVDVITTSGTGGGEGPYIPPIDE